MYDVLIMNCVKSSRRVTVLLSTLIVAAELLRFGSAFAEPPSARWWKGNPQTQSYWSDGDLMPEDVVAWYKKNEFHFVVLSDHDRPPVGERWKEVASQKNSEEVWRTVDPEILEQYRQRYGEDWVEMRAHGGVLQVRLKPVSEFGPLVNESQSFLVMPSQQIYTHVEDEAGHVQPNNAGGAWLDIANSSAVITPARSRHPSEALQKTVDRVREYAASSGRRVLLGLAHPNYEWQLTAKEIVGINGLRFMEIYTALSMCHSEGDEQRASAERIWDIVLTRRLAELDKRLIHGLASDDAHTFGALPGMRSWGRPGCGWIMVRAHYLTPESLFAAMERGEFYASSGVSLTDVQRDASGLSVTIHTEEDVTYTTQYIGTRRGYDRSSSPVVDATGALLHTTRRYSDDVGRVLYETKDTTSTYRFRGDEIYVRARILSDNPHRTRAGRGRQKVPGRSQSYRGTSPRLPAHPISDILLMTHLRLELA